MPNVISAEPDISLPNDSRVDLRRGDALGVQPLLPTKEGLGDGEQPLAD